MNEEYVEEKLRQLMPDEHHSPMGVNYLDLKTAVQQDLKAIMKELLAKQKIGYFKTLNGVTVYFKERS